MGLFHRHTTTRRTLALILAATLTMGCTSWRPAVGNRDALIATSPDRIRVSVDRGERVVLHNPSVTGVELAGYLQSGDEASRTTIPVRNVRFIEPRQYDKTRTGLLVGAVLAAGLVYGMVKLVQGIDGWKPMGLGSGWNWHM